MSKKRSMRGFKALVVFSAAAVLTACSGASDATTESVADMDPINLNFAEYTSAASSAPFEEFSELVEEQTDGKITFSDTWGGAVLSADEMPSGVASGIADIGMFSPAFHVSEYPVAHWVGLLDSLSGTDYPLHNLQAAGATAEFVAQEESIQKQFSDKGLKVLFTWTPVTSYNFVCTSPVRTLEEAAGKRIRTGGGIYDGEVEALGMTPVNMPPAEVYDGMQRGVIDCAMASPKFLQSYSWWDVASHYTEAPFSGYTQYVIMNQDTWDDLPSDAQEILNDSLYTWHEAYLRNETIIYEQQVEAAASDHGLETHDLDNEARDAITDYQNQIVNEVVYEEAPAGIDDPAGMIERYTDLLAEWETELSEHGYDDPNLAETPDDPATVEIDLTPYEELVRDRVLN